MFALNSTVLTSVTGSEDSQLFAGTLGAAAILATTAAYYALRSKDEEHEFPKLPGIQLYHAWKFFQQRSKFLQSNLKQNLGKSFSFNILHHNIVALGGEDGRRAFFSNPHLKVGEGYKVLMGAAPRIGDVDIALEDDEEGDATSSPVRKMLLQLVSKARIQDLSPAFLQDIFDKADEWGNDGKNGRIDPFTEIYDLVFLMTVRMATCRDLAKNKADIKKIQGLFLTLQTSSTPASLLLPWFPSPARKRVKQATTDLFTTLRNYVEARRHADLTNDTIDVLIADGETTKHIVDFVMTVLFVAIANTGIISCWVLVDLAIHPEWKEKCRKEIQDLVARHAGDSLSTGATLYEKLAAIPFSGWEGELPILDACMQESQRIALSSVTLRRNVREDMKINGQVIKRGDFLAYPFADVHFNPEYYPEPYKYDPGRWLGGDSTPNTTYPFIGWGAGRHPCTGMRVAKLEIKLISAVFLAGYEFDLVDKDGKFPNPPPAPDRDNIHQPRPVGAPSYFDFKRVVQ